MTRVQPSAAASLALRAEPIFSRAVSMTPSERDDYLRGACAGDDALREYLDRLLAAHATASLAIPTPAGGQPASMFTDPEHDPLLGRSLGEFRITRLIGVGGMGSVYEAEQATPHRTVALKVMRLALAAAGGAQRFRIETEVLAQLEHPGIARIYAAGVAPMEAGKVPYFAMELIRGVPLDHHVRQHPLQPAEVLSLMAAVCDAIDYAHRRGVVHRDLKPSNVLVTESGQIKILDFGVARSTGGDLQFTSQTTAGQIVGTLQYMSPEQALGDARTVDPRSDVYALGVMLYELLAGKRPYDIASLPLAAAAEAIRSHEPVRLGLLSPHFAGDVETIVAKAMEKAADRRYQSAADLAADIRRHLRHEPILARPATTVYKVAKFVRRNRAVTLGVSIAFLALAAGITATSLALLRVVREKADANKARAAEGAAAAEAKSQSEESLFRAYVANLAAADGALAQDDVEAARFHLDQCPQTLRQWEWRYLESRLDQSVRQFGHNDTDAPAVPQATVWGMALSRDGARLFVCLDQQIWMWDMRTGRPVRRIADFRGKYQSTQEIDVSPDGTRLVAAQSWDRAATIIDIESGAEILTIRGHADELHSPTFSPDGARLATGSFDGSAKIWDLRTGAEIRTIRSRGGHLRSVVFTPDGQRIVLTSTDGPPSVWNIADGTFICRAEPIGGFNWSSVVSPDGTRALSTNSQGLAWVWDLASGATLHVLQGHRGEVCGVAWSPDGRTLATGGVDRSIRLWDATTGIARGRLRGNGRQVDFLHFTPDSQHVLGAGHWSHTVKEWPARECAEPLVIHAHFGDLHALSISPDSRTIVTNGRDRVLRVFDAISGESIAALRGAVEPSILTSFTGDHEVLTLDGFGRRESWDLRTFSPRWSCDRIIPEGGFLWQLARSADGLLIGRSGGLERSPPFRWVWTRADAPDSAWQSGPPDQYATYALAEDGSGFTQAESPVEITRVLSRESAEPLIEIPGPAGKFRPAYLTTDPPRLFVGSDEGIDVYDLHTRKRVGRLDAPGSDLHHVRYAADSARIITTHSDGRIRLWDASRLKLVFTLLSSQNWVYDAKMTPSGDRIISIDSQGDVAIWDTTTRPARIAAESAASALEDDVRRAVAAALKDGTDPYRAADQLAAAPDLPPALRQAAARKARSYPGTLEGSIAWCWSVLGEPSRSDRDVEWANDSAVSIRRIARAEAMLSAISAAAHARRAAVAAGQAKAEFLRIADRRLDQARSVCREDDRPTRAAIMAADVMAALAAGNTDRAREARRSLRESLTAAPVDGPDGLKRYLAQALASGED